MSIVRKTGDYYLNNSFIPNRLPPSHPNLMLNSKLLTLFGEASFQLGQLNKMTNSLPDLKRFINAYVTKEALLSSDIEGIHTTLIDVLNESISQTKPNKETQLVLNYIKCLEVAQNMIQKENIPISSRVILAAHKTLMHGEGNKYSPGQYRKQQVGVGEFTPPQASEITKLMSDLEKYINEDNNLPPLIKAGLAHVQFETIHPFLDGNGRIGRLLIVLMLVSNELLTEPILYPSYYFKKNSAEYYMRLNNVRTKGDFEGWIEFYLRAIRDSCIEACDRTQAIQAQEICYKAIINNWPQFNKIQNTSNIILNRLYQTPIFGIKKIQIDANLSYNTVNSVITHFIERSEERRVGKECRSRWSPDKENKKKVRTEVKRRRSP